MPLENNYEVLGEGLLIETCPFCKYDARVVCMGHSIDNLYYVECNRFECGSNGPCRESPGDAVVAWNTRSDRTYVHSDDQHIDTFAAAMCKKMQFVRDVRGRDNWKPLTPEEISTFLREHVEKGDPIDVANFCMMLFYHKAKITPL